MLTKEQREIREKGITGTDAPIIAGVCPWRSLHELVVAKKYPKMMPAEPAKPWLVWGNLLEPVIAEEYARATGQELIPSDTLMNICHAWMRGTPDRLIVGKQKGLEIKTARSFGSEEWGASGTDNVPQHYLLQIVHYMNLTGADEWDLAVLIGNCDFRIYHFYRDKELAQMLFEAEREFFLDYIAGSKEPKPEWNAGYVEYIKRRFPENKAAKLVYEPDERLSEDVSEALLGLRQKKINFIKADFELDCAAARVQGIIGEHGGLDWKDESFKISWTKAKDRTAVNWEGVCERLMPTSTLTAMERSALVSAHSKTVPGSRSFRYTDPAVKTFKSELLGSATETASAEDEG